MEPLYTRTCDPLTGVCVDISSADGSYRSDPNTGQPVVVYDPAVRSAGQSQQPAATTPTGQQPTTQSQQPPTAPLDYGQIYPETAPATTESSGGGYGYGSSAGGSSRSYGYGSSGYGGGGYDDYQEYPAYATGQMHPAWGGQPLVAGGPAALESQGYDNRQQVYVPGGAAAGPFETRAAPSPNAMSRGSFDGGGGGGGSSNMGANSALGQKLEAKVRGMASKITSGGQASSSASYEPYRAPRPYRGPDDPRTRRRVEELTLREQNEGLYGTPAWGMPAGLNGEAPAVDWMQDLPMTDLALLAGAGQKNWAGGIDPSPDIYDSYYQKLNKRLKKGRPGIDFLPYFTKELRQDKSAEQFNQKLRQMYAGMTAGQRLSGEELLGNLSDPARGTYLRQQFKKTPYSQQLGQFEQSFGAILQSGGFAAQQQAALENIAQDLMQQYGQQYGGRRGRRRGPGMNQWVGQQLQAFV